MYIYKYTYIHIYIYIQIHIHVYAYTDTHSYSQSYPLNLQSKRCMLQLAAVYCNSDTEEHETSYSTCLLVH